MTEGAAGLGTQIFNNHVKSAILLAGFPFLLFLMLGSFFAAWEMYLQYAGLGPGTLDWRAGLAKGVDGIAAYGHIAVLAAGGWMLIAYFAHAQLMRMASGARPITRQQLPKIYNMLENLCISRGLPMPQFEIIESPALNAFATGIDQKSYRIVLTRGLVETLPDDELEAVIGHELTHILNGDVRLLIIAVVFVGMISFFAEMLARGLGRGVGRGGGGKKGKGAGAAMLIALFVLLIGYFFAIVIRFALSRKREFLADAGAIDLTKNPEAMMKALLRISGRDALPDLPAEVQQMCIENRHRFLGLFATHPSIEDRVRAIAEMTGVAAPPPLPVS